ncbi:hypothetical protein [Streptomyces curacoi]|uniref:Uncharacterized protein n=1 Tax=Streptomyces curacoi TaxID=146536 RepID=A0A117P3I0_9ACTN|nr:hypothetical protein [Streptomyces curacoi]KUM72383.1 hypothetical protein AQI70_24120 [Streptomyces curacoi]
MATTARPEQNHSARLPSGIDAWLLDCAPATGCEVCAANWRQLVDCQQSGDIAQAVRHATEIRDHTSGVHATP